MTVPTEPPRSELVYVPARPRTTESGRNVNFEIRQQPDGTSVLPAYSSVSGLVEALGQYQPWVCVQLTQLLEAMDGGRVARVLVDPPVDPGAWRWTQDDLTRSAGQPDSEPGPHTGQASARTHVAALINQPGR
jgi:SseB protein N-terminal domain